ncbi:unnamed protein product [Arctogadus glacialis]
MSVRHGTEVNVSRFMGFPAVFLFRCPTSSRMPSSLLGASDEGQPRLYEAGVEPCVNSRSN